MKRPFAVFCVLLAALSAMKYAAERPGLDRPLLEAVDLLREESERDGKITLAGTVAKCNAVSSGLRLSVNHLTIQRKDKSEQSLFPNINVTITTNHTELLPGDRIVAYGKAVFWESASNPGQFDAQSYYFSQNTVCTLSDAAIREIIPGRMSLARALGIVRRRLRMSYDAILEEHQAEIMGAVCLGERGLLGQEWKQLYQEGGISHIFAVSGLHISLIGMCLYRLLRRLGSSFGAACAVSGTVTALYVLMAGITVSAVRALIMFGLWLGAQLWGRKYDMVTAAAAAAMLLLFQNARNLSQSSFLLSFGAVLTIALLVPCLRRSFPGPGHTLLSAAGIWLGTLPIVLYFFYQTVPWSILINLVAVPLMSVLMACGLLAGIIGLVSVPLGTFLAAPASYILEAFDFLCHIKEGLPAAVWVQGRPALWRIALYYGILLAAGVVSYQLAEKWETDIGKRGRRDFVIRFGKPGRGIARRDGKKQLRVTFCLCLLWILCGVSCVGLMCMRSRERLAVTCLDVGQGDASLLRLPGGVSCLVDGGSTSESKVWKYRIGQAVKYYGVRTLDYLFLSHADEDHVSGIEEYLREYEPGFAGENIHGVTLRNLVLPPTTEDGDFRKLCELAAAKGIRVLRMEKGGVIGNMGTEVPEADPFLWSITCLAPDSGRLTGDRNEDSMVLMLRYGNFRMLFTGDLEGGAERQLAASGEDLSADVLKVGHHGSANASSAEFLARVSPETAVISCGEKNPYGHPSPETVERLQEAGSRIVETPQSGAVTIESDGRTYSVETYRKYALNSEAAARMR